MKLAVVLEGGATRAIFSAGVMDFLLEQNIRADYIVGVSAGICNGMSYASGQKGRAVDLLENYAHDPRYMGAKHLLNPKKRSYYNIDFVFGTVPNEYHPFDHDAYEASGTMAVAGVTNIETGEVEYMSVPPRDNTWKLLVASCSLPILFQPVEIDGKKYLDGGIGDAIPVDKAIEAGCDKIIVITTREKSYVKKKDNGALLSALVYRKFPEFSSLLKNRASLYNKSRAKLTQYEKEGRIFWIAPEDTTSWGRTDSRPEKIRAIYQEGYETAKCLLSEILKYLA